MHMMFVDESGDPGFPADGKWDAFTGSTHFARVGVIIHGWRWKTWNTGLVKFKQKRGLTWDAEIKAAQLRQGRGPFYGWDKPRRDQFLLDLMTVVGQNVDVTLIGVMIDKRKVDASQRDRLRRPEVRSLELLLERYNLFLTGQRDQAGIVILDPTKEQNDDNLRYFQSYLQVHSKNLKPLHIVESTLFAKSHTSNLIQIADVCTGIFYRARTRPEDIANGAAYAGMKPRFWRRNGHLHGYGIKDWPE